MNSCVKWKKGGVLGSVKRMNKPIEYLYVCDCALSRGS